MEKKPFLGFSLIELLVVITLIAILSGFGIAWFTNYKRNLDNKNDIERVYTTLKKLQLVAKTQKKTFCVKFENKTLRWSDCHGSTLGSVFLHNPITGADLRISIFGIFNVPDKTVLRIGKKCLKVDFLHICKGTLQGNNCLCEF